MPTALGRELGEIEWRVLQLVWDVVPWYFAAARPSSSGRS